MSRYLVRLTLVLSVDNPSEAAEFFDNFTEHLRDKLETPVELEHVPSSNSNYLFDCYVEVGATDALDAVLCGSSTIRAAASAVDVSTRKWPNADEWPDWIHNRYVEATELSPESSGVPASTDDLIDA